MVNWQSLLGYRQDPIPAYLMDRGGAKYNYNNFGFDAMAAAATGWAIEKTGRYIKQKYNTPNVGITTSLTRTTATTLKRDVTNAKRLGHQFGADGLKRRSGARKRVGSWYIGRKRLTRKHWKGGKRH